MKAGKAVAVGVGIASLGSVASVVAYKVLGQRPPPGGEEGTTFNLTLEAADISTGSAIIGVPNTITPTTENGLTAGTTPTNYVCAIARNYSLSALDLIDEGTGTEYRFVSWSDGLETRGRIARSEQPTESDGDMTLKALYEVVLPTPPPPPPPGSVQLFIVEPATGVVLDRTAVTVRVSVPAGSQYVKFISARAARPDVATGMAYIPMTTTDNWATATIVLNVPDPSWTRIVCRATLVDNSLVNSPGIIVTYTDSPPPPPPVTTSLTIRAYLEDQVTQIGAPFGITLGSAAPTRGTTPATFDNVAQGTAYSVTMDDYPDHTFVQWAGGADPLNPTRSGASFDASGGPVTFTAYYRQATVPAEPVFFMDLAEWNAFVSMSSAPLQTQIFGEQLFTNSALIGQRVNMMRALFTKAGNPVGPVQFAVMDVNRVIKYTFGTFNAQDIPLGTVPLVMTLINDVDPPYTLVADDRVVVIFETGDASNRVFCHYMNVDAFDIGATRRARFSIGENVWSYSGTQDVSLGVGYAPP